MSFRKYFSGSQLSILTTLVSGETFSVIMVEGYSELMSALQTHGYKPGSGSFTYAPINFSLSSSSPSLEYSRSSYGALFGAINFCRYR